jgi:hypothetical protein
MCVPRGRYVWTCLNPQGALPYLTWKDFVKGLARVFHDPRAGEIMGITVREPKPFFSRFSRLLSVSVPSLSWQAIVFDVETQAKSVRCFLQKPNQFELISLLIDSPVSEVRKHIYWTPLSILVNQNDRSTKTGSGQTRRKHSKKEDVFCLAHSVKRVS